MKLTDRSTLEMALIGYEAERQKIEAAIAAIRQQVDGHAAAPVIDDGGKPKRNMSASARRRTRRRSGNVGRRSTRGRKAGL
jgi:hypothetical protein